MITDILSPMRPATARHRPTARNTSEMVQVMSAGKADKYILALFIVFLFSIFFEGVIRWGLSLVGLGSLIYFRDALEVGVILFVALRSLLAHGWLERHVAIPFALLTLHFLLSIWMGVSFAAILFSFKLFVPLLFGCALWGVFYNNFSKIKTLFIIIFLASFVALIINLILKKMPWEGQTYDTFFGHINSTLDWAAGEAGRRLPGFTRASYVAAMVVCISGVTWMINAKPLLLRLMILAVGTVAIYVTTTKTLTLIYPIVCLWLFVQDEHKRLVYGHLMLVIFYVICLSLPALAYGVDFQTWSAYNATPTILLSFWDRLANMWPTAWDLIQTPLNYFIGSGMGSIGTAQFFGDNALHVNAGDNIAIYLYVTFGLFGLVYLSYPGWRAIVERRYPPEIHFWVLSILMVAYGYGMMSNMIEEQFFCVMLGLVFGSILYKTRTTDLPHEKVVT